MDTHLLKLDLPHNLLRAVELHAHELVLRLEREQLLEVRNRLLVPQRLEVACRSPTRRTRDRELSNSNVLPE